MVDKGDPRFCKLLPLSAASWKSAARVLVFWAAVKERQVSSCSNPVMPLTSTDNIVSVPGGKMRNIRARLQLVVLSSCLRICTTLKPQTLTAKTLSPKTPNPKTHNPKSP